MINLLVGPPGGGKSYEAVAYHVIPALLAGRKVITNLPLEVDEIIKAYPKIDRSLIEIRTKTRAVPEVIDWIKAATMWKNYGVSPRVESNANNAPFANIEDYGDTWRHPENGAGPFYVIDECHFPLPSKSTKQAVEEWFSMVRHSTSDVLLLTQSYGKINKAIVDLVQVFYRVRKASAYGFDDRYIRKVFDGVRGQQVNEGIRKYEAKYFPLYKSHTQGGGKELMAADIVPIWRHWTFTGAVVCAVLAFAIIAIGKPGNPLKPDLKIKGDKVTTVTREIIGANTEKGETDQDDDQTMQASVDAGKLEPFSGMGLHLRGSTQSAGGTRWYLTISQNGQALQVIDDRELIANDLKFTPAGPCSAYLDYPTGKRRFITCDAPTQQVVKS